LSSHSCLSLFISRFSDHTVLHSFPTRRSSDLSRIYFASHRAAMHRSRARSSCTRGLLVRRPSLASRSRGCSASRRRSTRRSRFRSEEHTSELQSRENLVCRLLLEKKKKPKKLN